METREYNHKWDNVKYIVEELKQGSRAKKAYENPSWGLSIKLKDRAGLGNDRGIKFGVVITLKEINGVNRFDEFVRLCNFRDWLVSPVNVENRLNLYNIAEEDVKFE